MSDMGVSEKPDSFDWVTERSTSFPDCSLPMAYQILLEIACMNVDRMNGQNRDPDIAFRVKELGNRFVVGRDRPLNGGVETATVVFELIEGAILVSNRPFGEAKRHMFEATAALGQGGECLLTVGEEKLRYWQVVQRALDDLFFLK
jgi:hypothetical protein